MGRASFSSEKWGNEPIVGEARKGVGVAGFFPPFPRHLLNGMQIELLNNFICGGPVILLHFYFMKVFEKVKRGNES